MKYIVSILIIALTISLMSFATTAIAGDEEWATAGKILTGVVAGEIIRRALAPNRGYYHHGYYYNPDYVVVDEEYVIKTYRRPRRYRHRRTYRPSWPSSTIVIEEGRIETEIVPIIE